MNNKDVAGLLRDSAIKHLSTASRVAEGLMTLADSLDPPRDPAGATDETPVVATCDRCGLRINGREYDGGTCGATDPDGMGCPGTFRAPRTMATARATSCTCDVCGDQIEGTRWIGSACVASAVGMRHCRGHYRLDPEPDEELTTVDGRPLGVTLGDLAMQEAVRDFVCGDTDEVPGLDMASSYGGRS